MKSKTKTNRQAIKTLLDECSDIELALLRERLMTIRDITMKSIEENYETWERRTIVHPSLYVSLCNKISENLNFD